MDYPIFNSKVLSNGNKYNLTDRVERLKYFHAKLGSKIDDIKGFIDNGNTFVGYLLAKKQAGKGTYSKMVEEILGPERFAHISVGDVVRNIHAKLEDPLQKPTLLRKMEKHYRGFMSFNDAVSALFNRSQDKVSVPTELILALLKLEIDKLGKKALFIDGLPRTLDQVSYSLYFRQLINYRDDPDFFVLIDVPESVIDARMRNRVVCPDCHTSKSMLINPTKYIRYDTNSKQYYFVCDNTNCSGYKKARYITKIGDSEGLESIRERLNYDHQLLEMAYKLHGIPKILIRSAVPVNLANQVLEDYEVQESYTFTGEGDNVTYTTSPWEFKDDCGIDSCTFYAATYVLNLFSQMHSILIS